MHFLKDLNAQGQRVFLRAELNLPLNPDGQIADKTRLKAALPTIEKLRAQGARLIIAAHLGRPKGTGFEAKFSLKVAAEALAELLGQPVHFAENCIGAATERQAQGLKDGEILLLENLRFHQGEKANDPHFASQLARLANIYVNDAFGVMHREHASVLGLPEQMPLKAAGLLVERELSYLSAKITSPAKPFVVILGGVKVSDKIGLIEALLPKIDTLLIGGAMAYTFLKAQGNRVGASKIEPEKLELAAALLQKAKVQKVEVLLPADHQIAEKIDFERGQLAGLRIADGGFEAGFGVDIGPQTLKAFAAVIRSAATIFWNGPLGIFEISESAKGTLGLAQMVAKASGYSIVGGGDSLAAINASGLAEQIDFISTGGGATLRFLEGKTLPALGALEDN